MTGCLSRLLSPGFLLFWVNDFSGFHRKELVAFLAFVPLLVSTSNPRANIFLRVAAIFALAVSAIVHEANVFLTPIPFAAILVRFKGHDRANAWTASALFGFSGAAALFAVRYASVESAAPICERILSYDLSPDL